MPATLASPRGFVLEEFDGSATIWALDLKNISWLPVAGILTRTFHGSLLCCFFTSPTSLHHARQIDANVSQGGNSYHLDYIISDAGEVCFDFGQEEEGIC
jgi:hypothetical protein